MIRLFVALALPPAIIDALGGLAEGVPGARWLRDDQMHLTLRFIGEVEADAFEMAVAGVGHFPPRGPPKLLWAGVRPNPALNLLQSRIESALGRAGLKPEGRNFSAHVTLARLNGAPVERVQAYLARHALFAAPPFMVEAFHLYSSRLSRDGSLYTIEASYPLRGGYDFEHDWDEAEDEAGAPRSE